MAFERKLPNDDEQLLAESGNLSQLQIDAARAVVGMVAGRVQTIVDGKLVPVRGQELQEGFEAMRQRAVEAKPSPNVSYLPVPKEKAKSKGILDWLLGE